MKLFVVTCRSVSGLRLRVCAVSVITSRTLLVLGVRCESSARAGRRVPRLQRRTQQFPSPGPGPYYLYIAVASVFIVLVHYRTCTLFKDTVSPGRNYIVGIKTACAHASNCPSIKTAMEKKQANDREHGECEARERRPINNRARIITNRARARGICLETGSQRLKTLP